MEIAAETGAIRLNPIVNFSLSPPVLISTKRDAELDSARTALLA